MHQRLRNAITAHPKLYSFPLLGVVFLASTLTSSCGGKPLSAASAGPPVTTVQLQAVKTGTFEDNSEYVGRLEAKQRVILRPQISGRVEKILVSQGDRVIPGTPMVQLRPERGQANVNAAISNVNAQRATLENAQAAVTSASAEIARQSAEVKRLEAELRNQEAGVELAKVNLERATSLVSEGAQAKQALDDRTRENKQAIAERDAAQQALDSAQQALQAARSQMKSAQATVKQDLSQLRQARAEVSVQQEDLGYNRILAPLNGVVGDIPIRVGDFVNAGDTLTSIIQNDGLDLRINVPTSQSGQLGLGLPVDLVDPNNDEVLTRGRLNFIAPQVDTGDQAVLTKARFDNRDGRLRDGQFVRARVVWDTRSSVLIPTTAISKVGAQDFVFVAQTVSKDGKPQQIAKQKPVKLGRIQGQQYQVLSGITAGEQLIVSGVQSLTDEAPIKPRAAEQITTQAPAHTQ
jgi:RND family efflux transporter MFP subunit